MKDAVGWHSQHAQAFAGRYPDSPGLRERQAIWKDLIERHMRPGARVLDFGCGPGAIARLARGRAREIVAIDGSAQMLALCRDGWRESDATRLALVRGGCELLDPATLGRFDTILCSSVLEYLERFWESVERLRDLLEPQGRLLFSIPNSQGLFRKAEPALFRLLGWPPYYAHVWPVPSTVAVDKGLKVRGLCVLERRYYAATPLLSAALRPLGGARWADNLLALACRRAEDAPPRDARRQPP